MSVYRLSLAERIALTPGFRTSADSRVLITLASFGDFETDERKGTREGAHCCPSIEKLQARIPDLSRRTVERSLVRLEADGWIIGERRHRHPTIYRVCVERLAVNRTMAKVLPPPPRSDRQSGGQEQDNLTATLSDLTATLSDLTVKVADHPDLYPNLYPSAPALHAGLSANPSETPDLLAAAEAKVNDQEAHVHQAIPDPDLSADRRDLSGGDPGTPRGASDRPRGPDQTSPPDAGVPLLAGSDHPGFARADRPRAPMGPVQQTFGPLDITPPEVRKKQEHWTRVGEIFKEALKQRPEMKPQRKSG